MKLIDTIKQTVRGIMFEVAKLFDQATSGFIRPWHVTIFSLTGHILVLAAIMNGQFTQAAVLLAFFGILDALDGALARYQNLASDAGMILDSSTDRIKETLVMAGAAYWFALAENELGVLLAVLVLGGSIVTSYIKAKGEVVLAQRKNMATTKINRYFGDGLFAYEIRVVVLIVGLALNQLFFVVALLTVGVWLTASYRLERILRFASSQQDKTK